MGRLWVSRKKRYLERRLPAEAGMQAEARATRTGRVVEWRNAGPGSAARAF
jgi:hypothetical protein